VAYEVLQTSRFARAFKKLHPNQRSCVVEAAIEISKNPKIGEAKKGDLAGLLVWKFRCFGQLMLLGYTVEDQLRLVYLEAIGPHENFYRNLKR
jgi:mRNA interferase RelE/StbE